MRTQDLVRLLATDPPRLRRPMGDRLLAACLVGGAVSCVLFLLVFGVRPDLAAALRAPAVLFKFVLAATVVLSGFFACRRAARPDASPGLLGILLPVALVLALGVVAELGTTPRAGWMQAAAGDHPFRCLALLILLSLLPAALVLLASRPGAPRSPALAGAAVGSLGGGIGAAIFALYCPNDSALFVALWYGAALLLAAGLGAGAGWRLLAW